MKNFVKSMDNLPVWLKIILALPGLDIIWNIYRTIKSAVKHNTLGVVLGVLLILVGWSFLWILDIITIVLKNKILWID